MEKAATIVGQYRYSLSRIWERGAPTVEFIMLNPSTADAEQDDPTIRRCIGYAKTWGYGGLIVRNLYAYRATDPSMLVNVEDPIGPLNYLYLEACCSPLTIVAWGANPAAIGWWNGYPRDITAALYSQERGPLHCLGVTSNGQPRHPLYLPASVTPIRWERP